MDLRELRDIAYVKAIMHESDKGDVLGYIGKNLPLDIIYSFNLYAIPVQSDDRDILKYGYRKTCGGALGTALYLKLDKCPLMHSAKIIILEDICPILRGGLMEFPKVKIYRDEKSLISLIEDTYNVEYDEMRMITAQKLLKEGEELSSRLPWEYGFYSLFLESLEERNEFLKEALSKIY